MALNFKHQDAKRRAWEEAMYEAMGAGEHGVCRSDAQGIAEARSDLVEALYVANKSSVEAAKELLA